MQAHEDHLAQLFHPRLDHQSGEQILHVVELSWVKSLLMLGLSSLFWPLRSLSMFTGFGIVTTHRLCLVDPYLNVVLLLDWADTTYAGSSQLIGVKEWRFAHRGQTYRLRAGKSPKRVTKERQAQFVDGFAPWVEQTLPQHKNRGALAPPAPRQDLAAVSARPSAPLKPNGPFPVFLVGAVVLAPLLAFMLWASYNRLGNLGWDLEEVERAEAELASAKKDKGSAFMLESYKDALATHKERYSSHLTEGIAWGVGSILCSGALAALLVLHKKRSRRGASAEPSGAPATPASA